MPNQRAPGLTQLTLRVPEEWNDRIEAVARKLSPPGVALTKNEALRAIVVRGLEVIEAELAKK